MCLVLEEHIEPDDPNHRGRWYVVIAGPRVGVWKYWLDVEGCTTVYGARYQSTESYDEAIDLYERAKEERRVKLLRQ